MKLAVGIKDVAHLRQVQEGRAQALPPLRHRTRSFPRRAAEITDGGSIYWVVAGGLLVRQRVLDVVDDQHDDASKCAGLMLDPMLVPVEFRPVKPFQGWRYLERDSAPADIVEGMDAGPEALPAELRQQLRALCLI